MKHKKNQNGLNITIVGCGKVGAVLLEQLREEGHDITVIDTDAARVQNFSETYDVMGVVGNGASYEIQMEAGIENADLIIAVTGSDELNLLCCTMAKQVGDCSAIARVRSPEYSKEVGYLREKLGLTLIINPELEAAKEASRILSLPTALDVDAFAHGQAEIIKFRIPEGNMLDGMEIASLGQSVTSDILICGVERGERVYIPSGHFCLKAGDNVSFVAKRKVARSFLKHIGIKTNHVKNTLIVGGSSTAYYLAKALINLNISVKIIEQSRERCEELAVLLPEAVIINGNGTNEDLLREEGIIEADSFVPLTRIDEENIVLTLFANQVSDAKVITKITHPNFKDVIANLNLGSVLYPQYITSESIIAYVRAKTASKGSSNIETLYHMFDRRVEAIEFQIKETSPVTDVPLMDLNIKDEVLIATITRKGEIIIPSGQDDIRVGDSVMVVTSHTGFNDIRDILR
ncbi:MAG: Trk system potassium transporter TrkA [Clostridia bacterium]|nr:Trk system potassium transporter TrkA [Clostridia bacterium]